VVTGYEVHYVLSRNTSFEKGVLNLITDGATASAVSGVAAELGPPSGITFNASYSGGNAILSYTASSTGFNALLTYYYETLTQ
jgi:hypothetical protein